MLWLRKPSDSGDNETLRDRSRHILEKIVVTGKDSNQPFNASRAGTVMQSQSIELSLARNSVQSGEPPIVDEECLLELMRGL